MDGFDGYRVEALDAMIGEIKRELAIRGEVYPRLVDARKLKAETAERQTHLLRDVLGVLQTLREQIARTGKGGSQ